MLDLLYYCKKLFHNSSLHSHDSDHLQPLICIRAEKFVVILDGVMTCIICAILNQGHRIILVCVTVL